MRRIVFITSLLTLSAVVLAPAAAAEQLHANVASWAPNDVKPGEPVSIVFYLYTPNPGSPWTPDGKRIAGVNDVEVVLHGPGQTRRFASEDLGDGRYSTEIAFPEAGGWAVRVGYRSGRYGAGDEIGLGKGAICVAADCVGPRTGETARADSDGWPWTITALISAAVLAFALVASGLVSSRAIGGLGRVAHTE